MQEMAVVAPITLRQYRPADKQAVCEIFADGMWGLAPTVVRRAFDHPLALACLGAAPCASVLALRLLVARPSPTAQALAVLPGLAALPLFAWVTLTRFMGEYINHSLHDDLADIDKAYSEPGSAFWIADMEGTGVVGIVALHRRSDTVAELRRLSVKKGVRGAGIAARLCKELIRHAQEHGFQSVFLVTTSSQQPALKLYWKLGWTTTKTWWSQGVMFYKLTLTFPIPEPPANAP